MFPADGERLLASTASEAAIGQRQLGPRGAHGTGALASAGRGSRAGVRDRRCPRPIIRAWPGDSCRVIHGAEFGVGDSYHVVRSEQDIFTARGHLAGNRMLRFPAFAAGPHRGSGPIRAPDSGDGTMLRGGPLPRAAGPIKVRAEPSFRSLCPASSTQAGLQPRLLSSSLDSSSSPPTRR